MCDGLAAKLVLVKAFLRTALHVFRRMSAFCAKKEQARFFLLWHFAVWRTSVSWIFVLSTDIPLRLRKGRILRRATESSRRPCVGFWRQSAQPPRSAEKCGAHRPCAAGHTHGRRCRSASSTPSRPMPRSKRASSATAQPRRGDAQTQSAPKGRFACIRVVGVAFRAFALSRSRLGASRPARCPASQRFRLAAS